MYFPDASIPFTRISEPKNRCPTMAPENYTSLLIDYPHAKPVSGSPLHDEHWLDLSIAHLENLSLVRKNQVLGHRVISLHDAYPVLSLQAETIAQECREYCAKFENLHLIGRSQNFEYLHLHDLYSAAAHTIDKFKTA